MKCKHLIVNNGKGIVTGLEISSLDRNRFIKLSEVYSQKDIHVTKVSIPRQENINSWSHLKEVKILTIEAEVGLLIGANVHKAMELLQVITSVDSGPYVVRMILGQTVNGPLSGGSTIMKKNPLRGIIANHISVAKLEELWQLQFKQEFPDAGQNEDIEMSKDDHQFTSMVLQSTVLEVITVITVFAFQWGIGRCTCQTTGQLQCNVH